MRERLKDRYNILALILILIFAIIAYQLFQLQVIHGKEYDEKSQLKLLSERRIIAPRGNIVDRFGVPIAINQQGFIVQIVKAKLPLDELNSMLLKLTAIFEKNNDAYYKSFNKLIIFNKVLSFGNALVGIQNKAGKLGSILVENGLFVSARDYKNLKSIGEIFNYLRKKVYKIDDQYTVEEAWKIMTMRYEIRSYDTFYPLCLARNVSKETVAEVEERHDEFPGVTTDIIPVRKYIDGAMEAHLLGYLGAISPEELSRHKDEDYRNNDLIGKNGIELAAEKYLRGSDGQWRIEVDIWGRFTKEIGGDPAIPGNDVVLTLDTKLQKVAMESLERNIKVIREKGDKNNKGDANAGSAVAMDVNTGEVLVLASSPTYDPSIFLAGPDDKTAQQAIADLFNAENDAKPAINRAISGLYAPGSTFKPVTAIAGLEEGVITPTSTIYDGGSAIIGGRLFKCLELKSGHGALTLERALATSCNIFFHKLGVETTIDKIDKWARYFGLGEKTGIDIPYEDKGVLASKEYKKSMFNDVWRPADTAQSAIGQLFNSFTPIQLANYVSTIANEGKRYRPFLIKRILKYDGSVVKETQPEFEKVPVKSENIKAVKKGMEAVANSADGTAAGIFNDLYLNGMKIRVAGKTGTAETGSESKHSSNALFLCYAPADNPQIAVAVVVERGAWGANTAPIARDILEAYFNLNGGGNPDDTIKPDIVEFTR